MSEIYEKFIKGSDNEITLTLTEDGSAIAVSWTELDIYIGHDGFNIHRTSSTAGITFSAGVLSIKPAGLSESLASLPNGRHRVLVKVKDASTYTTGVYFGADDSAVRLYFDVSDPP